MKELLIEAKIDNLYAVLDFVCEELERAGCPNDEQMRISVAVEEVFVNIAHYAYAPNAGNVIIRVSAGDESVIEFEDSGVPFNPLLIQNPDIEAEASKRGIGGLGIFMVKNIMDSVDYRYENNKNILVIKKARH